MSYVSCCLSWCVCRLCACECSGIVCVSLRSVMYCVYECIRVARAVFVVMCIVLS